MARSGLHSDGCRRGKADAWTVVRIGELSIQEIKQLLENAEWRDELTLAERCRAALRGARWSHRELAQPEAGACTTSRQLATRAQATALWADPLGSELKRSGFLPLLHDAKGKTLAETEMIEATGS